jgi:two-component system chemotaxis response regulator CheB
MIGASTGGPPVVASLLEALPSSFPLPVVVVQHISEGFGKGFTTWLGQLCGRRAVHVDRATRLEPGAVYVAPDDQNIRFTSGDHIAPVQADPVVTVTPSIDVLFRSGAKHFGPSAVAVLLTGMGRDGADGLKALFDEGALTIVQSPETCAVDSMPRSAIALEASKVVLPPSEIASFVIKEVG